MYFHKYFSNLALRTYFLVLIVIAVFSVSNITPLIWLVFCTLTVVLFFKWLHQLTIQWAKISDQLFRKKLFRTALVIRLISIAALYFFFYYMNGKPFEFEAGDSMFYDQVASNLVDRMSRGQFDLYTELKTYLPTSDTGYPMYLGIMYAITFKSLLITRLINALMGAQLCIVIYNLVRRNFTEKTARIAAIIMMILPSLIYYSSLNLKETLMILLLFTFLNLADLAVKERKITPFQIIILILSGASLFLFRTVLAVCAVLSVMSYLIFASQRYTGLRKKIILSVWMILSISILLTTSVKEEVMMYVSDSSLNQTQKINKISTSGNKFAKYGSKAIFFPILLIAPFPTFVNTGQENAMMLGGAMFIKNIYAFFAIIGLIALYKRKILLKHALVLSFLISYFIVLGFSGFVLSDRFHQPIVPVIVLLAAYGITEINKRNYKYFNLYLILLGCLIVGWNWFKLAGRDLF